MCKSIIQYSLFLLFLVIYGSPALSASNQNINKSNKFFSKALAAYNSYNYIEAESLLIRAIDADSTNLQAYLLLSDVADELKQSEQRIAALTKVVELNETSYPLAHKMLAQLYFQNGEFQKSLCHWEYYVGLTKINNDQIQSEIEKVKQAIVLTENIRDVEIIHLDSAINTNLNEYWPLISTDDSTLYFTRLITKELPYPFERLFISSKVGDNWDSAQKLIIGNNDEVNEGSICLNADASMLFFTACGRPDGKGSCDIYYMLKVNGFWTRPANAGSVVNTPKWESKPSVSAYGDKLYFTSNRGGGLGQNDIWMSRITKAGNKLVFSDPENLGSGVNSTGSDYSPFIHADDQTLYFASDGRYGLGRSDMFLSRFVDSVWTEAINLGQPINSIAVDDGLAVSATAHNTIFSSTREGAVGGSKDLYQMVLPDDLKPQPVGYLKGRVMDSFSKKILNAEIVICSLDEDKSVSVFSDEKNGYIITIQAGRKYSFNVSKKGYLFYSRNFNLKDPQNFNDATVYDIYLDPIHLDAKVVLNNIFFDFDQYVLKDESEPELNTLVDFLKLNPSVRIEISGHTDNVGNANYNLELSRNRAQAIADFLSRSIDKNRILVVGYGSAKPIDSNETEEGRSKNRRSELRIIGN